MTGLAFLLRRDPDRLFRAAGGFFQADLEVVTQVGTAIDVGASAGTTATAAEDIAEDVAESVGKTVEALTAATTAHLRIDAVVAVAIVGRTLVGVGEDLVGFLGFLELFLGFFVVRVAVRVVLHGQLAVGLFQFILGGVAIDAENLV